MYCGTCGKELPEGAKFCYECGAVVQEQRTPAAEAPPAPTEPIKPVLKTKPLQEKKAKKEKKERKKFKIPYQAIIAAATVLVLVILVVTLSSVLFPQEMVEVYVVTSSTLSWTGDSITWEYEWDENGNPITFGYGVDRYTSFEDYASLSTQDLLDKDIVKDQNGTLWVKKLYNAPYEAEYDKEGNLIKITKQYTYNKGSKVDDSPYYEIEEGVKVENVYEYDYTFDKKGRIETCEISYNDEEVRELEYTWDKRENLIRIIDLDSSSNILRLDWEYDSDDRLIAQWIWRQNSVSCLRFDYDHIGNVSTYSCTSWKDVDTSDYEDAETSDLDEGDASSSFSYTYVYNEKGNLISRTYFHNSDKTNAHTETFTYDAYGNPEVPGAVYDKHGNLLSYDGYTYTYEKVEMTAEAAQRYYQWEAAVLGGYSHSSFIIPIANIHNYYLPEAFFPTTNYYMHLIPYPQPKRPK